RMRRLGLGMLALVLALPALGAQDEKKPQSPKEQFAAMEKDFSDQQGKLIAEINKTKGDERQKLISKYYDLNKEYADKFYKLAENNPKDPVAGDALGWVVENAFGSPNSQKAADKLLEQFPEHRAVGRVCQNLARSPGGETKLKDILGKDTSKPG